MEIHVNVLFKHDGLGRLTVTNEPPYDVAPRFFLGATKGGQVVRYLGTLGEDVIRTLQQVIETGSTPDLAAIIRVFNQSRSITEVGFGPAFAFPEVTDRSARVTEVTRANRELLRAHFPYTFEELEQRQPCFAVIHDDMAVSVCRSARQTSRAAEASLDTLAAFRGRGYGVDVSRAWAAAIQGQGRIALYSTSWDNFASQSVARKLQLIQYGTDVHID